MTAGLREPCNRARAADWWSRGAGNRRTAWARWPASFSCSAAMNAGRQLCIADRVQNQSGILQSRAAQDLDHHFDHFGIDDRRFRADGFRADLKELAIAALLRALAAEHRADVVELLDAGNLVQAMLDIGAHHRRGGFRAQRERGAVAILPGVHFLADDVGVFAHAAREQRRLLEDRRANFVIVVSAEHFARHAPRRDSRRRSTGGRISRVPLTALIKVVGEIPCYHSRATSCLPSTSTSSCTEAALFWSWPFPRR